MSLPTSRNTTYAANSQVLSADLNAIQDAIIGKKFPSTPFPLPGVDWRTVQGSPALDTNGLWTLATGATNELVLALRGWPWMPGTRLTAVTWSFDRNSDNVSGEFQFRLKRRAYGAAPSNIFSGVATSGTGFTTRDSIAVDLAATPYTLLDGYMYWLSVTTATAFSGAPKFDGAVIAADRL